MRASVHALFFNVQAKNENKGGKFAGVGKKGLGRVHAGDLGLQMPVVLQTRFTEAHVSEGTSD
jgi:hypothetical protein